MPRIFSPLAKSIDCSSGSPRIPSPPTVPFDLAFRLPRIFDLPAVPSLPCRVAPTPLYGWTMMNSRLYSNFASSGKPADESSCSIESCSLLPDPPMHFQSQPINSLSASRQCTDVFKSQFASSCQARTAVQLPTGSPTERDISPLKSVEASANLK